MRTAKYLGMSMLTLAAICWRANGQEETKKMTTENLIREMSSADGNARATATAELFRRGKDVLPDLKMAGAKQVAPFGASVDGTRRLNMVYSVLEGFPPNVPTALAGYTTNSFGLHVEHGTTEEDIQKFCIKHQCTLVGKFTTEGRPNCYLQIGPGSSIEAVIQQILSTETKVTTINLNYFDR